MDRSLDVSILCDKLEDIFQAPKAAVDAAEDELHNLQENVCTKGERLNHEKYSIHS